MQKIAQGFVKSMISALVQIGAQQMTVWLLNKLMQKSEAQGTLTKTTSEALTNVEMSSMNAYRSTAAIPIVGPAMAPGAALAARAATMPMAAAAIAASGAGLAGMAHSGITAIPEKGTWLLDRGERVLSPQQNKDLMGFLNRQQQPPPEQTVYSPTIVVEAGASQTDDQDLAQRIIDEVFNRLVIDGRTNGPVRRAMTG